MMSDNDLLTRWHSETEKLATCSIPLSIETIIKLANEFFSGGFHLLCDDLCLPENTNEWSKEHKSVAYTAIGESVQREAEGNIYGSVTHGYLREALDIYGDRIMARTIRDTKSEDEE